MRLELEVFSNVFVLVKEGIKLESEGRQNGLVGSSASVVLSWHQDQENLVRG